MTIADIRLGLRGFLLADGAIYAAVGQTRIYPVILPQGVVAPSIVYNRITGLGIVSGNGDSWLSRPRFQIDAWAETHDLATNLANLVKERLSGYRGPMNYGSGTPQSFVQVQAAFYDSEHDGFDDSSHMFSVSRDYFIWYEEK